MTHAQVTKSSRTKLPFREFVLWGLSGLLMGAFCFGSGYEFRSHTEKDVQLIKLVKCPTEDSCQPEYSHGQWTIKEITP